MAHLYMIAYDVSDHRRRKRVAGILERYGVRVQKSVFECDVRADKFSRLVIELRQAINRNKDKVRCYPLCLDCRNRREFTGNPGESDGDWLVL